MMTQSVITQAANLFGSASGSVTSKGKQAGTGFDLIIDSNLKSGKNVSNNTETTSTKKTSVQNTDTKSNQKSDTTDDIADKTKTTTEDNAVKTDDVKSNDPTTKQTEKAERVTKTDETNGSENEDLTVDEQLLAQIAGMLQSIREKVMETLNLSSEELDQLLADQGMSITDLLQPENLQQLVLANSGETDILATLTDENLANTMKQLLQDVDGLKTEADLKLTDEQIKAILAEAEKQSQGSGNEISPKEQSAFASEVVRNQEAVNTTNIADEDDEQITSETNSKKDISVEVTKLTDTQENNSGNELNKESQDLKAEDQFQVFVDNLVKTSQNTQVDFSGNLVQVTELRDIANQIIERIKVSIQPDQTSMELQLNPENLGKVNLTVQSKNGVMTAQFVVQSELSKEAIESQLHTLRETLSQQGIKVEAIEVTVSTYAFEQNNSESSNNQADAKKNNSGKQISLEDALSMTELSEEESSTEDITGIRGSQVDYTA